MAVAHSKRGSEIKPTIQKLKILVYCQFLLHCTNQCNIFALLLADLKSAKKHRKVYIKKFLIYSQL